MNFNKLIDTICSLLLFKQRETVIEYHKIDNDKKHDESKIQNNKIVNINELEKTNIKTYLYKDNKYTLLNDENMKFCKKTKERTNQHTNLFQFLIDLICRPINYLKALYNFYLKGLSAEINHEIKISPQLELIAKEAMKIVTQIIKDSQKYSKINNSFQRFISTSTNSSKYIKFKTKKYSTLELYIEDHKLISKLIMNYIINSSVYREEMSKIFKHIMSVLEDKVFFCYIRALRINLDRLISFKGNWNEEDDLAVLGYQIGDLNQKLPQDSQTEIMFFNEELGKFEQRTVDVSNTEDNSSMFKNRENESKNVQIKSSLNLSEEQSFDLNLLEIFDDNKENKIERGSKNQSIELLENLNNEFVITITRLSYYEKYGLISLILEQIYPLLKDKHSKIHRNLFCTRNTSDYKSIKNILDNYKSYSDEAKRIINKYDTFRDIYPFKIHDLFIKKDKRPIIEITNSISDSENNDLAVLTRMIDFIKLMYFFKLYIYVSAFQNIGELKDIKGCLMYLRYFLENNENTIDRNNYSIFNTLDPNINSIHKALYGIPKQEFVFSVIFSTLRIVFKNVDLKSMKVINTIGREIEDSKVILIGKINSREYALFQYEKQTQIN